MSQYETKSFVFEPGNMTRYEILLSPFRRDGDKSKPPESYLVTWLDSYKPASFVIPQANQIVFESDIKSRVPFGKADLAAILFSIYNSTEGIINEIVGFEQYNDKGVYVSSDYKRPSKQLLKEVEA